ncbi:MAG TPA: hypothetical protein VE093_48580 [Polyangiaceae bacterium]|nr:hypothetical protein [Polyangiaceae bacterium]
MRPSERQSIVSIPQLCEIAPFFLAQSALGVSLQELVVPSYPLR